VVGISDEDMISAAAAMASGNFSVRAVTADVDDWMLIRFTIAGQIGGFAVRLPLPSSRRLKPWLYSIPEDAEAAAVMLKLFLDEEIDIGCPQWAATTRRGSDQIHHRLARHHPGLGQSRKPFGLGSKPTRRWDSQAFDSASIRGDRRHPGEARAAPGGRRLSRCRGALALRRPLLEGDVE